MKAEEFWNIYMNSTENTLDIYDDAMTFFSGELPDGFDEEYDAVEIVLEIQGHHETAKKFEEVIDFVKLIKEKHPEIYEETSVYSNCFLIMYFAFHKKIEEVEKVFVDASKNIEDHYDNFLLTFKSLLFYQHTDIVEKAVDSNFEAVSNSENLIEGAEYDLAILKLFNSLEKHYLESQTGTVFEKEKVIQEIQNYDFDSIALEASITLFEKGLYDDDLQAKSIQALFLENKSDAFHILQAQFIKAMQEKGFRFAVSSKIWELMMRYWNENNEKSKNVFAIETKKFDEFLVNLSGRFFSDNRVEMFAVLWGSVYIYDFLYEKKLIGFQVYSDFVISSRELKGILIASQSASLWEFDFVHRWHKPDSISEVEFVNEAKIFEKSLNFDQFNFSDFKPLIASELEAIGELSEYIIKEANREEEKFGKRDISNSFFESDDDFFISPNNLKPIVKPIEEKIGRNDPCYCVSGKKYKKCCMN
nr:SEC-C metal-binding domain-containing protein [uncultured Flavobacterium sp.]